MNKEPIILCLETSSEVCSVALSKGDKLLSLQESLRTNSHAEVIIQLIADCLKQSELTKGELNAVAVGAGPGSYTGLRIATSVAKGLCFALDIPLLAVSSLDNLIEEGISSNPGYDNYIASIDARRMEVYTKTLSSGMELIQEARPLVLDEELSEFAGLTGKTIVLGSGSTKMKELNAVDFNFDSSIRHSAKHMIRLALSEYENQNFQDVVYFEPDYLKEVYTTVSKKKLL